MKLKKLKELINRLDPSELERDVAVRIYGEYATEPRVKIVEAYCGFDWSSGIFMLVPEKDLVERS